MRPRGGSKQSRRVLSLGQAPEFARLSPTISRELAVCALDAARIEREPTHCDFLGYWLSLPGPALRALYNDHPTGRIRVFGFDPYFRFVEFGKCEMNQTNDI
jgi:hypothetical protein